MVGRWMNRHHPDLPRVLCCVVFSFLQAIITGRRAFFYSYDVATGKVLKVPRIFSSGRAEKHVETFAASPDGQWLAFIGSGGDCSLTLSHVIHCSGGVSFPLASWAHLKRGYLWLDVQQ